MTLLVRDDAVTRTNREIEDHPYFAREDHN